MLPSIKGDSSFPKNVEPNRNKRAVGHHKQAQDAALSETHYSHDKVTLSYSNDKGEKYSLELEHEELSNIDISKYSSGDQEKWKKIVDSIKDEFEKFKAQAIHDILSGVTGKEVENKEAPKDIQQMSKQEIEDLEKRTDELVEKMPEEWRPDAVSDRIFHFTASFFGMTESKGEDFYNLAKDSILKGFEDAYKELGELPNEVGNVIKRTKEMVLEKLDKWAEEQGILPKEDPADVQPQSTDETAPGGLDISA